MTNAMGKKGPASVERVSAGDFHYEATVSSERKPLLCFLWKRSRKV
jgi:hypothetical protein